jgi:hypothetical protein
VPALAANTMRTLLSLYVMTDRGPGLEFDSDDRSVPVHQQQILTAIGDLLQLVFPHQV